MEIKIYERVERKFDSKIISATLTDEKGNVLILHPFEYQPIELRYDESGIENCSAKGPLLFAIRFTLKEAGLYSLKTELENGDCIREEFKVKGAFNSGYVEVSKKDKRYFACSDGTPFFPIGINLAFPRSCSVNNNQEFGVSNKTNYMGLREYERWFRRCSEAGVNLVRIWLGHDYFSPDTQDAEALSLVQFSKIDMLLELAKKYRIKLKLTIEQFRYFVYNSENNSRVFNLFNKNLSLNGERCLSTNEWMTESKWKNAWLNKMNEFAKRYAGDTEIFAIELWNEMNCMPEKEMLEWNKEMLPKIKALFSEHLVTNSLGSLDCDNSLRVYEEFCWDLCDFKQMHRYLDQGAAHIDSTINPIALLAGGLKMISDDSKPIIVAETGAVEKRHSGEFKYYSCDDRGIIFVDCVYTPVFFACAGCGNIWHWDYRYVESKNLYKYFKPLSDMLYGIDFQAEEFSPIDLSDDEVYLYILKGKRNTLGFIRNKKDCWQTVLRDSGTPNTVERVTIDMKCRKVTPFPIWDDDLTHIKIVDKKIEISSINYGTIFKAEFDMSEI